MNAPPPFRGLCRSLLALLMGAAGAGPASALEPVVAKLHARATTDQAGDEFGRAVALTDRFLLVGAWTQSDAGNGAGAAHLYDARNGRHLRKLLGADTNNTNAHFGYGVALTGNLAVIGAPGEGGDGAVYGFDARTGLRLWRLENATGDTRFGTAVAVSPDWLVVGAPLASDDGAPDAGQAYLYRLGGATPQLARTFSLPGVARQDGGFGGALAVCGNLVVIGRTETAVGDGKVYVFDVNRDAFLREWTSGDADFGTSVAIDAGRVVVGATDQFHVFDPGSGAPLSYSPVSVPDLAKIHAVSVNGNLCLAGAGLAGPSGQAYLHDLASGERLQTFSASDATGGEEFGGGVALCGNRALIGAIGDDDFGSLAGAAYFYRGLSGPLPMTTVASSGDFAPGLVETDHIGFGDAFVNARDEVIFQSTLAGPGAPRGKNAGLFHTLAAAGAVEVAAQSGDTALGAGVTATRLFSPMMNRDDTGIFLASLRGTGIGPTNNLAIFRDRPGEAPLRLLGIGDGLDDIAPGVILQRWHEVCQEREDRILGIAIQLRTGAGGVSAANDSAVLRRSDSGLPQGIYREGIHAPEDSRDGSADPVGVLLGQLVPRVAAPGNVAVHFSAFLQGDSATNMGVFRAFNDANLMARKGETSQNTGTATFSSFLAETSSDWNPCFRASLTGPSSNNEGLFGELSGFPVSAFARKGEQPDATNEPGLVFSRFLSFWPAGSDRFVFLAKLAGPGVNATNDCALYLYDAGFLRRLLRERDPACGCDGARVASILRVNVDPVNGHYAVLTSLTGNPAANLALWTGEAADGTNFPNDAAFRRPSVKLRKGTSYQRVTGQTAVIHSFTFPNTADRGGAGGKGNGQVINQNGVLALSLQFTNRGKELLVGKP